MKILDKEFKECCCEEIDACYTFPASNFFRSEEQKKQSQHIRVMRCQACHGCKISASTDFEPSVYDLPFSLFNPIFQKTLYWKNQNLSHIAKEISRDEFAKFRGVGVAKVKALDNIFKGYGIKWK